MQYRREWTVVGLIAVAIAVTGVLASVLTNSGNDDSAAAEPPPAAVRPPAPAVSSTEYIEYDVTGNASNGAFLTYEMPTGTEQRNNVSIPMAPWIDRTAEPGDFLYISAQNKGSGSLTCTITVDGKVVAKQTSRGAFAIVTCQSEA